MPVLLVEPNETKFFFKIQLHCIHSGLAEQQQRQLESDTVEPLPERFGTLRMKAVSDPFRGPETPVADVGVEAARWEIPSPRDVNIADEDSSEESIGEETHRRAD